MRQALVVALGAVLFAFAIAGAAGAAPGTGEQVQANHDAFAEIFAGANAVGQEGTLGAAIAAGWMGNTSNPRADGPGVTPSLAPGIHVCTYDGTYDPNLGKPCEPVEKGEPFGAFVSNASQGQGQP